MNFYSSEVLLLTVVCMAALCYRNNLQIKNYTIDLLMKKLEKYFYNKAFFEVVIL